MLNTIIKLTYFVINLPKYNSIDKSKELYSRSDEDNSMRFVFSSWGFVRCGKGSVACFAIIWRRVAGDSNGLYDNNAALR